MSADAASLPCPICLNAGVFDSAKTLRDRLIHVSTNNILCPVCQEEICGLDKLTIHLFSHVKLVTNNQIIEKTKNIIKEDEKPKTENETVVQQKKPRSVSKNKTTSSTASAPIKYVKIYPKLPVISLNPVPIIDISQKSLEECSKKDESTQVKTENPTTPPNTCKMCGLQFIDSNILRNHLCLFHNIDDNANQTFTKYNCHLCPKVFKMRGSLMVHLRVAHFGFLSGMSRVNATSDDKELKNSDDTQDKPNYERMDNKHWQCDVCRKYFTTKYFLKKHKRLHTGETPYACTQCNKTFTFQQSYHKHLLYHNDEKPHTCSYCGRAFKELSTLHNHQRIHTGEKPFACETCGKCFRQRVSYLVHRRIHTGVMPYKCTACEKTFRYKVSQRTHKCQAQPPGTVVRQSCDLVEKLKKKYAISENQISSDSKEIENHSISFTEVSEANAELVRTGAKLSLEDMESDNFRIISEPFPEISDSYPHAVSSNAQNEPIQENPDPIVFDTNLEELMSTLPVEDKNVPSPSEIFRNLCLSKDDDFTII